MMNKENNRSAAGLRRSAIAERIRLREEWSELKGTPDLPLTSHNRQHTKVVAKKPQTMRNNVNRRLGPNYSVRRNAFQTNIDKSVHISSEVLVGVVALVEVGAEPRALALRAALGALGASVVPSWTPIVTHVVWAQGGCRATRAKARALASRLVSPLWVEACAAATKRLPEQAFPAAARASDLPSPRTLRQLLKKAEMENIPIMDLLSTSDNKDDDKDPKSPRLRMSTESELDTTANKSSDKSANKTKDTSHDTSRDKTDPESRVNTAPRRAMPISISPAPPARSRRKLFTQKEADVTRTEPSSDESEAENTTDNLRANKGTQAVRRRKHRATQRRCRRDAARANAEGEAETRLTKRVAGVQSRRRECDEFGDHDSDFEMPEGCEQARERRLARLASQAGPRYNGPRILLTGMTRSERRAVTSAVRALSGRLHARASPATTHVLLGSCKGPGSDTQGVDTSSQLVVHRSEIGQPRTLNALMGAARGCRVLTPQWAIDSHKAGKWLHHFGYEVPHLRKIQQNAHLERYCFGLMRKEYAFDVFQQKRVRVSSQAENRDAAIQLLRLCGGIVLDCTDGHIQRDGEEDITIGVLDGEVSSRWVFDSVAAARMRTIRRYVVNNAISRVLDK